MQSQYTLPPIADFLPLSWQLLMDHVLKNWLTRSPWLLLHSVLCQIIAYALAKKLPSELVDIDTLLSLGLVAHSTRIIADEGIQWKSLNDEINDFMRTHSNMDFAHKDAESPKGFNILYEIHELALVIFLMRQSWRMERSIGQRLYIR